MQNNHEFKFLKHPFHWIDVTEIEEANRDAFLAQWNQDNSCSGDC